MTDSVAVVDIGSGSIKLLITSAEGLTDVGSAVVKDAVKTRLIAGGGAQISEDAFAATAAAFDQFSELIKNHGPRRVAVVGTAVARVAANRDRLASQVMDAFSVELEVLSGEREAELSFAGAVGGRDLSGPVSVIDIGAGSTEFATGTGHAVASMSLPVGGRTLTDAYLLSDPYRPEELSSALTVMDFHLDDLDRELPPLAEALAEGTVVGVGAMTEIARVEIGSQEPNFGVDAEVIEKAGVEEVFRALATESAEDRAFNPGLAPVHVDDIVGAMCVLVGFMRHYSVAEIMVSERGLMHGVAAELLAEG
jgi:exopolyphosphatase/guanosine-5'-triphosphate,3'-diphosphate pyrophosphatase